MSSKLLSMPLSRRAAVFGALAPLLPRRAAGAAAKRPNFLVILSDDIGWGDFQLLQPARQDPHTEHGPARARGHALHRRAHPRRAVRPHALHRRHRQLHVARTAAGWHVGLPRTPQFLPGQKTIGHILQSAGYRTAMFGKTHFGGVFGKNATGGPDFSQAHDGGSQGMGFRLLLRAARRAPGPALHFFMRTTASSATAARWSLLKRAAARGRVRETVRACPTGTAPGRRGPRWRTKRPAFLTTIWREQGRRHGPSFLHSFLHRRRAGPYTPPEQTARHRP